MAQEPKLGDLLKRIEALEANSNAMSRPASNTPPPRQLRYPAELDTVTKDYLSNATPDTEDAITHGLNRVPIGFHTTKIDKAGVVYNSNKPWTAQKAYLKCSVASANVTLMFY